MSSNRIRLMVGLDIHDGKFLEFQKIVEQMITATDTEPGTLGYIFFLSADQKHCRLMETYKDVPAITAHFKGTAVQQFVPQLLKVASPSVVEFYGDPGPELTAMAAQLKPAVFRTWQGIDR
ncbi:MAG TPA: antibiotic biosynthesis monooxygenase [Terriglobales bacterium]|nr:antibiotic biosynthesis monooxygenase [Terriglobales bacterium]